MHGRIVMIAFQKGSRFEADWMPIMLKRLTFTGSTLRPRSVAEKAEIARALERHVWPLFGAEQLKPIIFRSFPLAEAAAGPRPDGIERAHRQDRAGDVRAACRPRLPVARGLRPLYMSAIPTKLS